MKLALIALAFLVALLLPGGLIGLYVARLFYRNVYLRRGVDQLREELGVAGPADATTSHPSGVAE